MIGTDLNVVARSDYAEGKLLLVLQIGLGHVSLIERNSSLYAVSTICLRRLHELDGSSSWMLLLLLLQCRRRSKQDAGERRAATTASGSCTRQPLAAQHQYITTLQLFSSNTRQAFERSLLQSLELPVRGVLSASPSHRVTSSPHSRDVTLLYSP